MTTEPRTTIRLLLVVIALGMPCASYADMITDWNVTATTLAAGNPVEQSRIFAMLHAATHDALNAIRRRYRPYAFSARMVGASPETAVATSAHAVLVDQMPIQRAALDASYANSLSGIADGPAKDLGIVVGRAAAAAILTLRSADGSNAVVPYTPGSGPEAWIPTPPAFAPAILPAWGNVTPFTLKTGEHPAEFRLFRFDHRRIRERLQRGQAYRRREQRPRTPEQSEIARFWYEGSPVAWNRIARTFRREWSSTLGRMLVSLRWSTLPWPMALSPDSTANTLTISCAPSPPFATEIPTTIRTLLPIRCGCPIW